VTRFLHGAAVVHSAAHVTASVERTAERLPGGMQQANHRGIARGFGPYGRKRTGEPVTMTIACGAPPLERQADCRQQEDTWI